MGCATRSAAMLAASALLLLAGGCSEPAASGYQGYAEGEFVLVAAPVAGTLETLPVRRGQTVAAGAPLFALERVAELAAVKEAEQRLHSAEARVADLGRARRRDEIAALEAQIAQAAAQVQLSGTQLRQQKELAEKGFVSPARLDEAQAAFDRDSARLAEARSQLQVARASVGRQGEIEAARTEAEAARAVVAQARWRHDQKQQAAPVDALVFDTFFRPGEWVPAGRPVVSLLPPQNLKVRFYVPEPVLGSLRVGQAVKVRCDGCADPVDAAISHISPEAEYTPPVIYSKESRARIVFLVEARPAAQQAMRLHPGQPVDVFPVVQ